MDIQKFIENLPSKKKESLSIEKVKFFMNKLGNPQERLKFVHITGTNGKGSVVEMLNNILLKNDLKVGKFISPHLVKYNERISINNVNIEDKEIENIYEEIKPIINEYNEELTFFEFTTVVALLYFYKKNVDIVVIEVGLGGLHDCTNIINPIISVITSIGYDHTHILGKTLKEIAIQKAGIIKEKSETVYMTQQKDIDEIIIKKCNEKNNRLHLIKEREIKDIRYGEKFQTFSYKQYKDIEINLKGKKQIQNGAIVLECCDILKKNGFKLENENIKIGLKTVVHKARFEKISEKPIIIFDGAHNEQAISNLKETIDIYYKNQKKIYIISMLKTKDYMKIIDKILTNNNIYIFTNGNNKEKYTNNKLMYEYANNKNISNELYMMELKEAIEFCKNKKKYISFIIGSFYIYGNVIDILNNLYQKM